MLWLEYVRVVRWGALVCGVYGRTTSPDMASRSLLPLPIIPGAPARRGHLLGYLPSGM